MRSILLACLLTASFAGPALAQEAPPDQGSYDQQPSGPPPGQPHGKPAEHMKLKERFEAANVTHDGRLTEAQAEQGGMHAIAKHWDRIDTAHKGYVTFAELRTYHHSLEAAKHASHQQGGPGGQPGGPPPGAPGYQGSGN